MSTTTSDLGVITFLLHLDYLQDQSINLVLLVIPISPRRGGPRQTAPIQKLYPPIQSWNFEHQHFAQGTPRNLVSQHLNLPRLGR